MVPMHGIGGRQDLPLPFSLVLVGAAAALVVSFVVLAFAWRTARYEHAADGVPLPRLTAVLDAPLLPDDKIALAQALGRELTQQQGQIPDLHRAFVTADLDATERLAAAELERNLDEQLERAATRAFRDSFLIGAGLAVAALLTVIAPRRRRTS